MKWPIRNQILFPFAALQIVAVAGIALFSAYLAAERAERQTTLRLRQVVETLGESRSIPLTPNVLQKMRGLSGAHFVVVEANGQRGASTLADGIELPALADSLPAAAGVQSLPEHPSLKLPDGSYFTARLPAAGANSADSLIVLYPESSWRAARWQAAFPPLAIGGATLLVAIGLSAWMAARIGRRIHRVENQVARIAAGDFQHATAGAPHDEVAELTASVNRMCDALRRMQSAIRKTERTELVAQLASGLAHQLRNAITGARLAVQVHLQRCGSADTESLDVALRQLTLTEEQVKGLLSLHGAERRAAVAGDLAAIIDDAAALVGPACRHARVSLDVDCDLPGAAPVADSDVMRGALLNLLLNAVEAAGAGGAVRLHAVASDGQFQVAVADNGPGIADELRDSVFDPFVTTKPEGVGLGLALAKKAAADHRGALQAARQGDETVFTLSFPHAAHDDASVRAANQRERSSDALTSSAPRLS